MGLFGKHKDPKELVREWQTALRKEGRGLDRQIQSIQREQEKVKRSLKTAAKKGDRDVCKILARELVASNKAVSRIYSAKAQIRCVENHMSQQLSTLRLSGAIEKSAEVMKSMQDLVKVSDVAKTMRDMSKEMMKAGMIEEMIEDSMESVLDDGDEDMEEEVEKEVDKILFEVTAGDIGKMPASVRDELPSTSVRVEKEDEEEEDLDKMAARLQALRS